MRKSSFKVGPALVPLKLSRWPGLNQNLQINTNGLINRAEQVLIPLDLVLNPATFATHNSE